MGNIGSSRNNNRSRRRGREPDRPSVPPSQSSTQPQIPANQHVFAAAALYPSQYPNPNPPQYYQYSGSHVVGAEQPNSIGPPVDVPPVEHQKAVTIRNDVHVQKETLRVEPDEENPGRFLVTFTFNATVTGSINIIFFAKEDVDCNLTPMKEDLLEPVTVSFQKGLGQKFRQPSGTGIDFSLFEEKELLKEGEGEMELYPLAVKADAFPSDYNGSEEEKPTNGNVTSQILLAVFEREKGEYRVRVLNQILCMNGTKYKLQEIYGIGNSIEGDVDENQGKECVICLSEPRDTTVLPCRHMCMCNGCAKLLKFQPHRCPICRQPVEQLLEIKVNNSTDD